VSKGQPLYELETEKVTMDVEAEADGILRQLVVDDTKLKPGDVVGCILAEGEAVPAELTDRLRAQIARDAGEPGAVGTPRTSAPRAASVPAAGAEGRLRVTPLARRSAAEHGVDLSQVRGSGPEGRITEQDVRRHLESGATAAPAAPPPATAPAETVAFRGRRKTIADRMVQSLQTMAQLTLSRETPVDDALRMVHGLNREWRRDGVSVTLTALVVKACALAVRDHPQVNSRLEGGSISRLPVVNVGVAVDADEGLIVPVIRGADRLILKEVARQLAELSERVRGGSLRVEDVAEGTFTVTSLEALEVDVFTPIINPPQAAILGIGRVKDIAAFEGTQVVRRQAVTLSLTFDHRLLDGAPAARFLGRVCELLERPYVLI